MSVTGSTCTEHFNFIISTVFIERLLSPTDQLFTLPVGRALKLRPTLYLLLISQLNVSLNLHIDLRTLYAGTLK